MADPPDGFFNLKHRLVGATVLILIAVTILPRVLTGTDAASYRSNSNSRVVPQIQTELSSNISSSESDTVAVSGSTRIEILDQTGVVKSEERVGGVKTNVSSESFVGKDRSAEISLAPNVSVTDSIVTGWIAQVGIFQQTGNVRNLISELQKDGIDPKVETIEIDGRQATRIWLGPFSTRSEATREGNKAMMRTDSKPIVKEWP
jgi:cell division septation protein DedD